MANKEAIKNAVFAGDWATLVFYRAVDVAEAIGFAEQDCQTALDAHFTKNANGGGETQTQFANRMLAEFKEANDYNERQHASRMEAYNQDISGYEPFTFESWLAGRVVEFAKSQAALGAPQDQSGHDGAPAGPFTNVSDPGEKKEGEQQSFFMTQNIAV